MLDTGSKDKTIELTRNFCMEHDLILMLKECEWGFYGPTRNILLNFVEEHLPINRFYMILDANDEFSYSYNFVPKIHLLPADVKILTCESTWVKHACGFDYVSEQHLLIRSGNSIRYKGYVHEYLIYHDEEVSSYYYIRSVNIKQDRTVDDIRSLERADKDIQYFERELADTGPQGKHLSRIWYYLGRTYFHKKDYQKASEYYQLLFEKGENRDIGDIFMSNIEYAACPNVSLEKKMFHLLMAYENLPDKIESLVYLVKICFTNKLYHLCYMFINRACQIDECIDLKKISEHGSSLGLVNVSDYRYSRWILKVMTCTAIGKYSEARKTLLAIDKELVPENNKTEYEYYNEYLFPFFKDIGNSKIILIFGGFSHSKWDISMVEGDLGGSETVISKFAVGLAKSQSLPVFVCCDCEREGQYENVRYFPLNIYHNFITFHNIQALIVHRFSRYLSNLPNIKQNLLVLEDLTIHCADQECYRMEPYVKKVICKTPFHKTFFTQEKLLNKERSDDVLVIGNAIDIEHFEEKKEKIPWRFIYTSCPTRGGWNLIRLIPKIQEIIPEATFYFFIDLEGNQYSPYHRIPEMKQRLSSMKGVFLSTRIPKKQLAHEMLLSDIWLFPTNFVESYCITAVEMQMARVLPIYTKLGALEDTIANRGIPLTHNVNSEDADYITLDVIKRLKYGYYNKEDLLNRGYEWACQQTWDKRVSELMNVIDL